MTTFLLPVNSFTANPNDKHFPGKSYLLEHEYKVSEALDLTNLNFLEDIAFFCFIFSCA